MEDIKRKDNEVKYDTDIKEEIFFKVTNVNEKHNGYQYYDGLNILEEEFQEFGSCVPGGFYFSDAEKIHKFYNYGSNLRIVKLPKNNPNFKMVKDPDGDKWRANMIILCEKYDLNDINTYQKFGLKIPDDIVERICKSKSVENLNKLYESCHTQKMNFDDQYLYQIVKAELCNDRSDIYDHLLKMHDDNKINLQHIEFRSLMYYKYDNKPHLLNFILNLNYRIDFGLYTGSFHLPLDYISKEGDVDKLKYWLDMFIKNNKTHMLQYSSSAMDNASDNGHIKILDTWAEYHKKYGLKLKCTVNSTNSASRNCNIDVLNWWRSFYANNRKLKLFNVSEGVDYASKTGNITMLNWWMDTCDEFKLPFKCTNVAIDTILRSGNIHVLEWWKNMCIKNNQELNYSLDALNALLSNGNTFVFEWIIKYHEDSKQKMVHFNKLKCDYIKNYYVKQWLNDNMYRINAIRTPVEVITL